MTTEKILHADVLDIIFENRNKSYGAYSLRKFYNNRLYKALGVTFLLAAMLCMFSFLKKEKKDIPPLQVGGYVSMAAPPIEKPKDILQPQKPATVQPKINTQKVASNILITKDPVVAPINSLRDDVQNGSEDIKGKPGIPIVAAPQNLPVGEPVIAPVIKVIIDKITPNNTAEIMPSYPGGMEALRKFLQRNLVNPQEMEEGQTVTVKIKFIVGYDGVLKGFETVEDGGTLFNNEVIRVLKKMPQWIPGKTKGENVSVYNMIPVKFTAAD